MYSITAEGGLFNKGEILAELDIKDNLWFFECHFKGDPVMPGCLGLDAMWQLLGFYLGWLGNPGHGRALGVNEVKFTGEVVKQVKLVKYVINIKRLTWKGYGESKLLNKCKDGVKCSEADHAKNRRTEFKIIKM